MRILSNQEYNRVKSIFSLSQKDLKKALSNLLSKYYTKMTETDDYILAEGEIPVALVAHLDTVFAEPPKHIYYDIKEATLWSPEGLGADDRAGIYAVIKLIKEGYKPYIILTTDEEYGGLGAGALAEIPNPWPQVKYLIELDRRGQCDCVFYNTHVPDFTKYVESFGFSEANGSFSDISIICPAWKVCGVNLSVGYRNEHSYSETWHLNDFFNTYDKVIRMLKDAENAVKFQYNDTKFELYNYAFSKSEHNDYCYFCGKSLTASELFGARAQSGQYISTCIDCAMNYCDWCKSCGEVYEINSQYDDGICSLCKEEGKYDF